eukprot:scaffold16716_cov134-Isochrysis_galbana.AAC.2
MGRPQRGRPVPDTSGLDWRLRSRPNRSRQAGRRQGPPPPSSWRKSRSHDERRLLPRRPRVDRRLIRRKWAAPPTRAAEGRRRRLGVSCRPRRASHRSLPLVCVRREKPLNQIKLSVSVNELA